MCTCLFQFFQNLCHLWILLSCFYECVFLFLRLFLSHTPTIHTSIWGQSLRLDLEKFGGKSSNIKYVQFSFETTGQASVVTEKFWPTLDFSLIGAFLWLQTERWWDYFYELRLFEVDWRFVDLPEALIMFTSIVQKRLTSYIRTIITITKATHFWLICVINTYRYEIAFELLI